jgi:hypothetical protein
MGRCDKTAFQDYMSIATKTFRIAGYSWHRISNLHNTYIRGDAFAPRTIKEL